MAQVDIAGALPAARRANGRVATVAVNSFVFKQRVYVGDLLSFYASVVKSGKTSVTVNVEVYSERSRLEWEVVKVTEATLTYVATGEDGRNRLFLDRSGAVVALFCNGANNCFGQAEFFK